MLFVAGESAGKGEEAVLRWGSWSSRLHWGLGVAFGDDGMGKPGFPFSLTHDGTTVSQLASVFCQRTCTIPLGQRQVTPRSITSLAIEPSPLLVADGPVSPDLGSALSGAGQGGAWSPQPRLGQVSKMLLHKTRGHPCAGAMSFFPENGSPQNCTQVYDVDLSSRGFCQTLLFPGRRSNSVSPLCNIPAGVDP